MPVPPGTTTPAQALTAVADYFNDLQADRQLYKDWCGGLINGGPNLDGEYPLMDFTGNTYLVPCPAKIAGTVAATMGTLVSLCQPTWVALDALVGATDNVIAAVFGDAGTHVDPVSAATVQNSGLYRWDDGLGEWENIWEFVVYRLDTDVTMAADSDAKVPTQKAVKAYVASSLLGRMKIMGPIDLSTPQLFPAAAAGECYVVSVAGRIGGVLGPIVDDNTLLIAHTANAGGNYATAGPDWFIIEAGGTGAPLAEVLNMPGASYTLLDDHKGQYINLTEPSEKTVTVQDNATEPLADNSEWHFYNSGAGDAYIAPDVGVNIIPPIGGSLVIPQNGFATLKRVAVDTFHLIGVTVSNEEISNYNEQVGTTYTLALSDIGRLVAMNNAAANTLTIPPNIGVPFPVNTRIDIGQLGAGQTTIVAGAGVTLLYAPGLKITGQYRGVTVQQIAADTWWVFGALEA